MIKDYLNKFSLKNKKVFIIGGVVWLFWNSSYDCASAELFIFDKIKKNLLSKI